MQLIMYNDCCKGSAQSPTDVTYNVSPTLHLFAKWNMLFPLAPTPHQFHLPSPIRTQPQHIPFDQKASKLVFHKTQTYTDILYTETAHEKCLFPENHTQNGTHLRPFPNQDISIQPASNLAKNIPPWQLHALLMKVHAELCAAHCPKKEPTW